MRPHIKGGKWNKFRVRAELTLVHATRAAPKFGAAFLRNKHSFNKSSLSLARKEEVPISRLCGAGQSGLQLSQATWNDGVRLSEIIRAVSEIRKWLPDVGLAAVRLHAGALSDVQVIMEAILLDLMFELPSLEGVKEIVISQRVVPVDQQANQPIALAIAVLFERSEELFDLGLGQVSRTR